MITILLLAPGNDYYFCNKLTMMLILYIARETSNYTLFEEKYFLAKYLRFYTITKNFIKIRPKMSKRKPI